MLRLATIPLTLLALLAGAVAWSNKDQGKSAGFTFVNRGENKTLDIGVMSWMQDIRIAYALWEGLYTLDPVSLKPVPGSADRIEVTPDKTIYTFHIRSAARWSNGEDLTAADFVFGWRRMMEQPSEYTYLFDYLRGAKAYEAAYAGWAAAIAERKSARRPDFSEVGVEAIDAKTLRVSLVHPVAYFSAICAFPSFFPQHSGCMKGFAQKDPTGTYIASYDQAFTRPPNLVTNGPYRLLEWSFKRRLRLQANDYYWDRSHVYSRVIDQIYAADDPLAQFRIYEAGHADWLADVDGDLAADLRRAGRKDLKLFPAFGTYFYVFNCNPTLPGGAKNPLSDRRVRRAFCMALNKEPIVRNVTRTNEPIARTYIPVGVFPDYPSPKGLPYDVAAAREQMAAAGYPNGAGFPHLRILFNNDFPQHGDIAQVVRRQWQQNLGIEMDLEGVEIKTFGERLHNHEFSISRASWYGDYDDPSTFTDVYKSTSENNNPSWKRPDYDALLKEAELELDPVKRLRILARAEDMLLEDAPMMPIFQYVGRYLIHDNVHGIPLEARQMIMMHAVKVVPR